MDILRYDRLEIQSIIKDDIRERQYSVKIYLTLTILIKQMRFN